MDSTPAARNSARNLAVAGIAFLLLLFGGRPAGQALAFESTSAGVLLRVPDDYPTIAAALAAAAPGDTVGVRAGTYEQTFVPRDGVPVLGGFNPTFTVRDPDLFETRLISSGRIVTCQGCAGPTAVIDGFIMTGGGGEAGGLMLISGASPTVSHNRFENGNGSSGGSIYITGSSSHIIENVFSGNRSTEIGGAIAVVFSIGPVIEGCRFEGNQAASSGGAVFLDNANVLFRDCVFVGNNTPFGGGGLCIQLSEAMVDRCVFFRNTGDRGGGICCAGANNPTISSCTIADNTATIGGGVFARNGGVTSISRSIVANNHGIGLVAEEAAAITPACNDVWNNLPSDYLNVTPDSNSISADPLFCDFSGGDLTLETGSPCAPANSPVCGLIGALPAICPRLFIRVPDDHPTIVAAINLAGRGDTVAVAEGHYLEHVTLKERVYLLGGWRSDFGERDVESHPTVIDAGNFLSAVVAQNGETPMTVIDGFFIKGGNRSGNFGGGMACFNSSPTIRNNVFTGNKGGQGAAIACRSGARPIITGNLFVDNTATDPPGGAIYIESDPILDGNTFDGNRGSFASGVAAVLGARPVITRNIVVNGLGGVGLFADKGAVPEASCNDVWNNENGDYYGMLPGPNSLSLDPLFCLGDHSLQSNSPCAPPQAPAACGVIGARGVGCGTSTVAEWALAPIGDWLGAVTPNPAHHGGAAFDFGLAHAARVRLVIIDLAGRHVRTVIDESRPAGPQRVRWDGCAVPGQPVSSGVYFYRLWADGRQVGQDKLVVLK